MPISVRENRFMSAGVTASLEGAKVYRSSVTSSAVTVAVDPPTGRPDRDAPAAAFPNDGPG